MRFTQLGVLRLLTTGAAMNNQPLTMPQAWAAYDRLFEDDRVAFIAEPAGLELCFRKHAAEAQASPKLWADSLLLAYAEECEGAIVTFDRALASRTTNGILLA